VVNPLIESKKASKKLLKCPENQRGKAEKKGRLTRPRLPEEKLRSNLNLVYKGKIKEKVSLRSL